MKNKSFHLSPGLMISLSLAGAISLGAYLFWSQAYYQIGFPLDDAWIHQTYARNLVETGKWVYGLGNSSAGSTSPLFTMILSLGYLVRVSPYLWTYFLGWLSLVGISLSGVAIIKMIEPINFKTSLGIGLFLLFEWHLVWAAGSGMETLIFAWVVLGLVYCTLMPSKNWQMIGMLVGISIWIRPEGITCLGPIGLAILIAEIDWRRRIGALIRLGIGVVITVAIYMAFNYLIGGQLLPNTFFAKQAEYAELTNAPLWQRGLIQVKTFMVGSGLILLPGFIYIIFQSFRSKQWLWLLWSSWVAGVILIYAWRLPVIYQHGRYLIPAMVVYFVIAWAGIVMLFRSLPTNGFSYRVALKSGLGVLVLVSIIFWILGARAYAHDVAIIETEMVATAKWIAKNTPQNAIIATHDIGAMGYFSDRRLIDLAGLITPQVIPFLRDQEKLKDYLVENHSDFLVAFPSWYPDLVRCLKILYETNESFSPVQGGENMVVYIWQDGVSEIETCQNR